MLAAIVDAAHELAERSLSIRDVATARLAATVGEKVDPASEIPVRVRLRAEALATTSTASSGSSHGSTTISLSWTRTRRRRPAS